jgi:dTDP-4-dehydrorhamnose reductase
MKVLVLGHNGMLGRAAVAYFGTLPDVEVHTTASRYGDADFKDAIDAIAPDFILNAIGKIPQKKPSDTDYTSINTELPLYLDTLGYKVILPTTDCEFKGTIPPGEAYNRTAVRDADDVYGMSKAIPSAKLEAEGKNTKIIRTSIIGHEKDSAVALLDWFLAQEGSTRGYTNHYWNGITTLQWAKECYKLMKNWDTAPTLTQLGTPEHRSKYEVLLLAKAIYHKDIEVIPFAPEVGANKCVVSDYELPNLEIQLEELKAFYGK